MVDRLRTALVDERIRGLRRQAAAVWDVAALRSAARAAIVMPAVFALADKMIRQPQTSLFAAFGSFALLVLVEFTGPPRTRLVAYLGLACVGAAFVTLGTLCSRNAWLAAGAMAVVGFVTLFAGVINGYAAAGATGALLAFVLPVTLTAPNSAIPERLEGWALAAGAGICALMLLWPPRRRVDFHRRAAEALRVVADLLDASRETWAERARVARASVDDLGRRLLGTQHRPTGPTGPMAALASLPDELDWLLSFVAPLADVQLELACAEDAEAMAAAAGVLRTSGERLEGRDGQPDFERLEAARDAVARALMRRLPELPPDVPAGEVPRASELEKMAAGEHRFGAVPIDPMSHAMALNQLDREVRGAARPADHLYFADNAKGFVFTREAEIAGYAYVWPNGRIGPMASVSHNYSVQMLAYALAALRASYNAEWCTLLVPGVNAKILRAAMKARLRITCMKVFASDNNISDLTRYIGGGSLMF